jgi:acetyl esterase/lipase
MVKGLIKIKNVTLIAVLLVLIAVNKASGQQSMPLYEGKIPNSIQTPDREYETSYHFLAKVSLPTLTVYTPATGSTNGTAVIVCPGGGYTGVNIIMEGYAIAQRLNALGIIAFVLKYRLPDDSTMVDKSIGPLQDAQRAMLIVKTRAKEWNIDTAKVGIMGFSAGGHLAATAGTHFSKSLIDNPSNISLRPAFMILVYPVISFTDSIGHIDSRTALIGKHASAEQKILFSNELQVNSNTPPAFLIHAGDDALVSVKNSVAFYLALQRNKVPAGMHIFPKGQHGFFSQPANNTWFQYCVQWLQENGWAR